MSADLRLGRWQDVLSDLEDGSVRLVLTSPPYDNARAYAGSDLEAVDFGALGAFCRRVLMPGGVLAIVIDGAVNDGATSTTPFRVVCEWAAREGWRFQQMLAYGRQGAPGEYAGRFRRDHEPLLVFVRDGAAHICNKGLLAVPAAAYPAGGTIRQRDGVMRGKTSRGDIEPIRHRGSIWSYGSVGHGHDPSSSTGHPATFAERFARDAVTVWSNPGDLVLDPFAGSGTVARACIDTGRRFVGSEMSPGYHAEALKRLAQTSVFGRSA